MLLVGKYITVKNCTQRM